MRLSPALLCSGKILKYYFTAEDEQVRPATLCDHYCSIMFKPTAPGSVLRPLAAYFEASDVLTPFRLTRSACNECFNLTH